MLIPRLVFGCGHLTGGASMGESVALLRRARAGGIRHFDTAPSYGIGTAEGVVGRVLGGEPDTEITAKIGSCRPCLPLLKTIARGVLRTVRGGSRSASGYQPTLPGDPPSDHGCFDPDFMARSFAISCARLRRRPLDHVLLHESYAAPPSPEVITFLDRLLAQGDARSVGLANGAIYDPALRAACPPGWTVQAAIDPRMLLAPLSLTEAPTILHTLVKTDGWLRATDPRYLRSGEATLDAFATLAPREALAILLPYCLAAANVPTAKLIYTSSLLPRLDAVLGAARTVDDASAGAAIAAHFATAYTSA